MGLMITGIVFNSVMALVIGSVFYNLPNNTGSLYLRGALIFFAILLAAFASALEVGLHTIPFELSLMSSDLDLVCPTSDRGEAVEIRLLPSICGSHW